VNQRKNSTAKTRYVLPLRMHSSFYEVRISKIDPGGVTRQAKYEQKYGQNEHLARANKAPDGSNRSLAWPRGLPRHFDFPAGRVGGFGVHGAAPAVPPAARDLDFFISNRVSAPAGPWASGAPPEAHAGISFEMRYFGYIKQTAEGKKPLTRRALALSHTETRECAFTRCALLR
jgi:hypothetical protein